eukprot:CAMPEP_0183336116 /NCGR_PEP_ID=MMETSP0164_2-20130417/4196_1 /TAXON_ID=221442 /ORGANISM="Coccolithus pelagicus ssp braarudi, Strain PLY182g" /LENGTH=402 /DNA_ID=CAMNT_0025505583 /DNA_START=70 /DNA_END=1275 /DNA_ORIENTATION=+
MLSLIVTACLDLIVLILWPCFQALGDVVLCHTPSFWTRFSRNPLQSIAYMMLLLFWLEGAHIAAFSNAQSGSLTELELPRIARHVLDSWPDGFEAELVSSGHGYRLKINQALPMMMKAPPWLHALVQLFFAYTRNEIVPGSADSIEDAEWFLPEPFAAFVAEKDGIDHDMYISISETTVYVFGEPVFSTETIEPIVRGLRCEEIGQEIGPGFRCTKEHMARTLGPLTMREVWPGVSKDALSWMLLGWLFLMGVSIKWTLHLLFLVLVLPALWPTVRALDERRAWATGRAVAVCAYTATPLVLYDFVAGMLGVSPLSAHAYFVLHLSFSAVGYAATPLEAEPPFRPEGPLRPPHPPPVVAAHPPAPPPRTPPLTEAAAAAAANSGAAPTASATRRTCADPTAA